jgi:copper chaperone CopZ
MKRLLAGSMLATAFSFASLAADKTDTIKVSGWHCAGCASKTEAALKEIKGVQSANADNAKKEVRVTYDDTKLKRADLEKAIAEAGFAADK